MISFSYGDEFQKEFKALRKAYPSLGELDAESKGDFADLKKALKIDPIGYAERINQLGEDIVLPVYKVRKFACATLKSSTKLRIIYVYDKQTEEVQFIEFIEMYAKADKENEDRKRIEKLLKGKTNLGTE